MIAVIDSGVANISSVISALVRIGANAQVTADSALIAAADKVILPGVGAAPAAMARLKEKNLIPLIQSLKQPVLGICLGMQLLFSASDEGGDTKCLECLDGRANLLPASAQYPVPHMGWNQLQIVQPQHPLVAGVQENDYVYFVHSYALAPASYSIALSTYGIPFTAIAAQGNFMGCQFHPERSGKIGETILKNFCAL